MQMLVHIDVTLRIAAFKSQASQKNVEWTLCDIKRGTK